jgi:cytochrome b561
MDAMHALVNVASHQTKLPGKAGRFDQINIALHWLTVLLVFTQFATAWLFVEGGDGARIALAAHRVIGAVIWIVVASFLAVQFCLPASVHGEYAEVAAARRQAQ